MLLGNKPLAWAKVDSDLWCHMASQGHKLNGDSAKLSLKFGQELEITHPTENYGM